MKNLFVTTIALLILNLLSNQIFAQVGCGICPTGYTHFGDGPPMGLAAGTNNAFFGDGIGATMSTTARFNTMIGSEAGASNIDGFKNTFVGAYSGHSNTLGDGNTFLGMESGYTNVSGEDNVFLGRGSGYLNSNGDSNIFLGTFSGYSSNTGDENVCIGRSSGFYFTGNSNQNSFLGSNAGHYVNGSKNICIGAYAGPTGTYSALANVSNRLYLDNVQSDDPLMYGEFDNNVIRINGEFQAIGEVGIGTTNPNSKLHVNADPNQNLFRAQSDGNTKFLVSSNFGTSVGAFATPPAEGLYVHGDTGLGDPTPSQKLSVNGAISIGSTSGKTWMMKVYGRKLEMMCIA